MHIKYNAFFTNSFSTICESVNAEISFWDFQALIFFKKKNTLN